MIRVLIIVAALLAGLFGLFLSIRGGALFLGTAREITRAAFGAGHDLTQGFIVNSLLAALIAGTCLFVGVCLCWISIGYLRGEMRSKRSKNGGADPEG